VTDLPGVSLLTCTYNRFPDHAHLLAECVEGVLRQTYLGPIQLVIFNSCPAQKLTCDISRRDFSAYDTKSHAWRAAFGPRSVKIVNAEERPPCLGACRNAAVEAANYDLLMPADDDDVILAKHVETSVQRLGDYEYSKPAQVFYLPGNALLPIIEHPVGYRHHASIFRRSAWERAGGTIARACPGKGAVTWQRGYPPISGDEDAVMDESLRRLGTMAPEPPLNPQDFTYLYRFGCSPVHISGMADHDEHYRLIGKRPIVAGTFEITPAFRRNYPELVARALKER